MNSKNQIDFIVETFSLRDISREILGESDVNSLHLSDKISELKKELFYYMHQAENGPEKSKHVFADKVKKLKIEIEKLENIFHEHGNMTESIYDLQPKDKTTWLIYVPNAFGGLMLESEITALATLSNEEVKEALIKRGKPNNITLKIK